MCVVFSVCGIGLGSVEMVEMCECAMNDRGRRGLLEEINLCFGFEDVEILDILKSGLI